MGVSAILLLSFLSFIEPLGNLPGQSDEGFFEIEILRAPAFQSRMISMNMQEGKGVAGGVLGGIVTANFPEGYIVLKTPSDTDLGEIQRLIKEKMASFPCSCGEYISMSRYGRHVIQFDRTSRTYSPLEFRGYLLDRYLKREYFLLIEPISVSRKNIWLRFEFRENLDSSRAEKRENQYLMLKEEIFNRTMDMKPDQTLLVGFAPPKFNNKYRGSAYWFIIKWMGKDANIVLEIESKKIIEYNNYSSYKALA